jgi:hypothetical protein
VSDLEERLARLALAVNAEDLEPLVPVMDPLGLVDSGDVAALARGFAETLGPSAAVLTEGAAGPSEVSERFFRLRALCVTLSASRARR